MKIHFNSIIILSSSSSLSFELPVWSLYFLPFLVQELKWCARVDTYLRQNKQVSFSISEFYFFFTVFFLFSFMVSFAQIFVFKTKTNTKNFLYSGVITYLEKYIKIFHVSSHKCLMNMLDFWIINWIETMSPNPSKHSTAKSIRKTVWNDKEKKLFSILHIFSENFKSRFCLSIFFFFLFLRYFSTDKNYEFYCVCAQCKVKII